MVPTIPTPPQYNKELAERKVKRECSLLGDRRVA